MTDFFKKASLVFILPSFILIAAALPFQCNTSKDSGIFKSDDSGMTWQQKVTISNKENIASKDIYSLAQDTVNSEIIFIGTKGSGVYQSLDSADTWQQVGDKNNILQKTDDVNDIAISQKNSGFIYLATYGGGFGKVLQSQDGGQSWHEVYVISQSKMPIYKVTIDPVDDAIIYVGTAQGGLLKSTDYGSSWQPIKWFDKAVTDIKIDKNNNQIIYVNVLGKGIFKTGDQGQTWQPLTNFMKNFKGSEQVGTILIDQHDSRNLYVSLKDTLLVSYDQGQVWQKVNILMPAGSTVISALAQDPQNSAVIYYGAGSVIYRTANNGQTWTTQQLPSSKLINLIKIDPKFSNIIYIGMSS